MILPNERPPSAPYGYCREKACEGKRSPLRIEPALAHGFYPIEKIVYCPRCHPEGDVALRKFDKEYDKWLFPKVRP